MFCKTKSQVEMTLRCLAAELKSSQKDELAKHVSKVPSCSTFQMFEKEDPKVVDIQVSERLSAHIIFKWQSALSF